MVNIDSAQPSFYFWTVKQIMNQTFFPLEPMRRHQTQTDMVQEQMVRDVTQSASNRTPEDRQHCSIYFPGHASGARAQPTESDHL